LAAITYQIYQSSPESDSESDSEVYMVEHGDEPHEKTVKEIQREAMEEIARVAHFARDAEKERGTMTCRMTQGNLMMSLGMVLLQGDTTQSSTNGAQQTKTDSETGHDQSQRKSVGSSTKESSFTECWLTTPCLQGCSLNNSHPTCLKIMKWSMCM
jgi:hypothetical protein